MASTMTTTAVTATATATTTLIAPKRFQLDSLPAFPDDIPTAPLVQLSFAKLMQRDPEQIEQLIQACEGIGFFYLDLSSPDSDPAFLGERVLDDVDNLFDVAKQLYDLPVEEKVKYDFLHKGSYYGYKGYGAMLADVKGNKDRCEFFSVSKDDLHGITERWPSPEVLEAHRPLMKSFTTSSHAVAGVLLEILNDHLQLAPGTLANLHRSEIQSSDALRFIKAPPQPADDRKNAVGGHTDFGSFTVLFNRLGGLQILPPREKKWLYVQPLQNNAIINVADALTKLTNGRMRSNIHRVVSPPGEQAAITRYSVAYFVRPENHVLMKRLEGSPLIPELKEGEVEEDITVKDWVVRRAMTFRHSSTKVKIPGLAELKGTEAKILEKDKEGKAAS